MFALAILLLLLTATPALAQSGQPTVVLPTQPQPGTAAREAESDESAPGDKAVIKFEGLRSVAEADVLRALREERLSVYKPFAYDAAKVGEAARVVRELLTSEGFLHAKVTVREERGVSPNVVTLVVDEGQQAHIEDVRFVGNQAVPSARLSAALRGCLERISGRKEGESPAYGAERVEYCVRRDATGFLRNEGYMQAEAGRHTYEETETGVRVIVNVREGTRYRVGRIRVKGATVFLPEQLVEMLELKRGDIADGGKVARWAHERLRDEYGARGYIQYAFDIEPVFRPPAKGKSDGVADFEVEVYEGERFIISAITFKGNRLKTADELKGLLSLREGDVFDRRRLREGMARLNELNLLCGYADGGEEGTAGVYVNVDEEKGLASLTIQIVEDHVPHTPSKQFSSQTLASGLWCSRHRGMSLRESTAEARL